MELLTAMAIIGITAALVAPALTNIMPDKTKMQVIKAHKALSDVTKDLLNDPYYYYDYDYDSITYIGLAAYKDIQNKYNALYIAKGGNNTAVTKYSQGEKYCYLLADKFQSQGEAQQDGFGIVFNTIDGTRWSCVFNPAAPKDGELKVSYTMTIDLNGDEAPNKLAAADNKNPDQFKFSVDTYGKVTAHNNDKLTAQYLKTPTKFNNKKEDYKAAFGS